MLDFFLIVVVGISAFMGLKIGLIRAGFTALGIFAGSVLGGQLSDDIGRLFSGIDSDSAVATVIAYAIIITVCVTVAAVASVVVRKVLNLLLMGWADKLAGGALGVAAGAVIASGIIMGMANLTYGAEVGDDLATKVLNSTLDSDKAKKRLEGGLTHSSFVKTFLDIVEVVPSSALWFVPSNFRDSLDVLNQRRSVVGG
jgi:membrane protein required for colicin V production